MGLSFRIFLLDQDDVLFRLPNTKFDQMLRNPASHRLPRFVETQVRMTDVGIELIDRKAVQVVRVTFNVLTFDDDGNFNASAFDLHQRACAEQGRAKLGDEPTSVPTVIDAASRFVAQGGSPREQFVKSALGHALSINLGQCKKDEPT